MPVDGSTVPADGGAAPAIAAGAAPAGSIGGRPPTMFGAEQTVGSSAPAINSAVPVDGSTVPADGGAAPAIAAGAAPAGSHIKLRVPEWHAEWCMQELHHFRNTAPWAEFLGWVEGNLATPARQALAVHTTTACQYRKAPGPSGSELKSCGLDTLIPDPADGGRAHVELYLPDAFAHRDGLAIKYVSQQVAPKCVEGAACVELLCYLVVSAPARVRLHPSNWKHGMDTIAEFRTRAVEYGRITGFNHYSLAWQVPEIHAGHPLEATSLIGAAEHVGPLQKPCTGRGASRPAFGGHIDHEAVLETLRGLRCNTPYASGDPRSLIPTKIGKALEPLLPKGGLLKFLQQYPKYFEVTFTGGQNRNGKPLFSFTMSPCIHSELGGWKAGGCSGTDSVVHKEPAVGGSSGGNDLVGQPVVGDNSGSSDPVEKKEAAPWPTWAEVVATPGAEAVGAAETQNKEAAPCVYQTWARTWGAEAVGAAETPWSTVVAAPAGAEAVGAAKTQSTEAAAWSAWAPWADYGAAPAPAKMQTGRSGQDPSPTRPERGRQEGPPAAGRGP